MRTSAKKIIFILFWPIFLLGKIFGKFIYLSSLRYEFLKDWSSFPNPEWFDHEFDLAFFDQWKKPHFFERGVYLQELLQKNTKVLDLCCGDGSVSALFIAPKVKEIIAVDFDPSAINFANKKYSGISNISFKTMDIRNLQFNPKTFGLISWDAAIEHFTLEEMKTIFASIKNVLTNDGILAGSTVSKQEEVQHHDHEHEFLTTNELKTFLSPYFKHVFVWERKHDDRTNFYFRCSDHYQNLDVRCPLN